MVLSFSWRSLVTATCVVIAVAPLKAQLDGSIEQIYLRECLDKADTELCLALKARLKAKIPGSDTEAKSASVGQPLITSAAVMGPDKAVELRKTWGVLADLAGTSWQSRDAVQKFEWIEPGKALRASAFWRRWDPGTAIYSYVLRPNPGQPNWLFSGRTPLVEVLQDGTTYVHWFGQYFDKRALKLEGSQFTWLKGKVVGGAFQPSRGQGSRVDLNSVMMQPGDWGAFSQLVAAHKQGKQGGGGGGLLGVMQGALAGAAGMAGGGGGMDAAIAGAAAGAVAGAAGVDASSIQGSFRQGASEVNASSVQMQSPPSSSGSSGGAIIVDNTPASTYTPPPPPPPPSAPVEAAPREKPKLDCWGRPLSSSSGPSSDSSSRASKVCPQ